MRLRGGKTTSIRRRLTLWNVAVLALVLVVFGTTIRYTLQASLVSAVDRDMTGQASHFQEDYTNFWRFLQFAPRPTAGQPDSHFWRGDGPDGHGGGPERFRPERFRPGRGPNSPPGQMQPSILGLNGHRLDPRSLSTAWDPDTFSRSAQGQDVYSNIRAGGEAVRILSMPLRLNGKVVGVIQVGRTMTEPNRELAQVTRILLTLIPLALLIAGVGGAFMTNRALRPVRQITQAAERIEAQNLSGRLPVMGDDEFAELASTFNGMLERLEGAFGRLERAFEQQRHFTSDASHELRTPLTIIKANTSLSMLGPRTAPEYREALEAVDRAADRMSRIVQDLLLLARSDAGQLKLNLAPVRLSDVLEQAVESARRPEGPAVRLTMSDPAVSVLGDADALIRLFINLLSNAVRHTPVEGRVTVAVRDEPPQVAIEVRDTGEGIAPEHLPHLFERFYRADTARSGAQGGTGLGLAISRSIVEAHGGSVTIESVVGSGTTVRVTLPRSMPVRPDEAPSPHPFLVHAG